jgi:hypothetical protein
MPDDGQQKAPESGASQLDRQGVRQGKLTERPV